MRMRLSLLLLALTATTAAAAAVDHGKAQIEWLRSRNGYFNPKLEIRRADPNDPDSFYGMFANEKIEYKERLIVVPRDCLVTAGPDSEDDCVTVRNLVKEMKLGDKSEYSAYVNYLLDQPHGQLPSAWSAAGKKLLKEVIGKELPPSRPTGLSWKRDCGGSDDPFEENAYMMVNQRGWDDVLIPVYDMMSHRNGPWLNTMCNHVHTSEKITVRASRDIEAGEQIYTTYNFCEDCGARADSYGTPEMLRDYGFVEQYPQRWIFHQQEVAFELDEKDGKLIVTWLGEDGEGEPDINGANFMEEQLARLYQVGNTTLAKRDEAVPENEWEVILNYHKALTTAFTRALEKLDGDDDECYGKAETCTVPSDLSRRYDDLEEEPDDLNYQAYTCEQGQKMDFPEYKTLELVNSPYQRINFYQHPENKDTCFELDRIVQICGSYRPHYHEMVVHYTARFVDKVKRVVFVGGGDSMLLHEIIKYPSLEVVVGLELDQQVTRKSFKHFGTQPHWDNDKVEWWYGDAAKSLLMLPKDYFGSFDMVLVDLSETVMSMLVTDGLDIMGALALLLNPEGILVKNELYLEQLSDIFDYTIQLHYYDIPVICSQALIMGSNKVDFLTKVPKDHKVDGLYITPLDHTQDRYEDWHDYRRNDTLAHKLCRNEDEQDVEPTEQKRSPGVLMIIEAEDATGSLAPKKLQDVIEKVLKGEKLTIESSVTSANDENVVTVVLREGYVTARAFPEDKYVAFDLLLWSSFEKQESIKKKLIKAVGSGDGKKSSSYRIAAGGMFGTDNWKEDEKNRGPRFSQKCERPSGPVRQAPTDAKAIDAIVDESIAMVDESDFMVAVVCGLESEPCPSLDVVKNNGKVSEAVPIYTCPELKDEKPESMFTCEMSVWNELEKAITDDKQFRAIAVDPSAPFPMGQIIYKIFSHRGNRKRMLTKDITVVAPTLDGSETWRRNLLDRFRKNIVTIEPVFTAEVLFNSTDSTMEMGVVSSGDTHFSQRLTQVNEKIEKRTGLVSDLRRVHGGGFKFMPDFVPTQFALPGDYDQSGPLEQWISQKPLGLQTVFQLEMQEPIKEGDKVQGNWRDEGKWYKGKIISVNSDNTFDIHYNDGDKEFGVPRHLVRKAGAASQDWNGKGMLSQTKVKFALKNTISAVFPEEMDSLELNEFAPNGDGCILVAIMQKGNVVVVWDGMIHVDINLFTYAEDIDHADRFHTTFMAQIPYINTVLSDQQPRGTGRVVNLLSDIEPRSNPHWALGL